MSKRSVDNLSEKPALKKQALTNEMLEPSIVDYYNEIPQGVHVIEKLNKEYDELDNKYKDLKKKYDKLKTDINMLFNIEDRLRLKKEQRMIFKDVFEYSYTDNEFSLRDHILVYNDDIVFCEENIKKFKKCIKEQLKSS